MNGEEDFENSFWHFIEALRVLSHCAEEQCDEMGSYNAGWEIKHNVVSGASEVYSLSDTHLNNDQIDKILDLVGDLNHLPQEALVATYISALDRPGCITAMEHPSWSRLREKSHSLLQLLKPAICRNIAYFKADKKRSCDGDGVD